MFVVSTGQLCLHVSWHSSGMAEHSFGGKDKFNLLLERVIT